MTSHDAAPPQGTGRKPALHSATFISRSGSDKCAIRARSKRRGMATDTGAVQIGERLALLRKQRGITQVEMAEKLGLYPVRRLQVREWRVPTPRRAHHPLRSDPPGLR